MKISFVIDAEGVVTSEVTRSLSALNLKVSKPPKAPRRPRKARNPNPPPRATPHAYTTEDYGSLDLDVQGDPCCEEDDDPGSF